MSDLSAIVDESALDTFLESVSTLVIESRIHFETSGLRIEAVDAANVASVRAMLGADAFESYELDERAMIGVKLARLEEALAFADSGSPVGISTQVDGVTETEVGGRELSGFLELETDGIAHDIALIDPNSIRTEPDFPDLDLPAEVVLEGRQLDRAVKAADTVSDHLKLTVDEDGTFGTVAKGDTDSVEVTYERDELIDVTPAEAESLYSIGYLKDMARPIPSDAEVTLRLGVNFPAEIRWQYGDGYGSVMYLLAPRVKTD